MVKTYDFIPFGVFYLVNAVLNAEHIGFGMFWSYFGRDCIIPLGAVEEEKKKTIIFSETCVKKLNLDATHTILHKHFVIHSHFVF